MRCCHCHHHSVHVSLPRVAAGYHPTPPPSSPPLQLSTMCTLYTHHVSPPATWLPLAPALFACIDHNHRNIAEFTPNHCLHSHSPRASKYPQSTCACITSTTRANADVDDVKFHDQYVSPPSFSSQCGCSLNLREMFTFPLTCDL